MFQVLPELDIFVLGHEQAQLNKVPQKPFLHKVNLNFLELPILNTNHIAENRFFLLNKDQFQSCKDFIGVLTANFDNKYPSLMRLNEFDKLRIKLKNDTIYAASPTETFYDGKWVKYSYKYHLTIEKYLQDMATHFHLSLEEKPTFWANNFICHKSLFLKFLEFFKKVFDYMHSKYGFNYQMKVDDTSRTAAYVYERVSMLFFSNQTGLKINKIPDANPFSLDAINWISLAHDNYEILTKRCLSDLEKIGVKSENICHMNLDRPQEMKTQIAFGTDIWHHSIQKKIALIIDVLENNMRKTKYKYFICHDCDIQFFPNKLSVWEDLFEYIDSTSYDFYFQPEIVVGNYELCAGFYIIKKDRIPQAVHFLKIILKHLQETPAEQLEYADQSVMKMLQHKTKSVLIDEKYCTFGGIFREEYKSTYLFHHAINARTLAEKIEQMRKVRTLMQASNGSFKINI